MNNKILSILAVCFLVFSCKNEDKKADDKSTDTEVAAERKLVIQMDVIQKTADNYAVYFTEDNSINFNAENTIWNEVAPASGVQTLNFYFPEEIIPTRVRFDLGNKPEREDIVMNKFKIQYGDKSVEVKGSEFFNYFQKNDSILTEIDPAAGSIKFLKKQGSKAIPFFYPTDAMNEALAKIMK